MIFATVKSIIAIFLSLLVVVTAFRDVVVIISFKANQQSIAANHCVNNDRPELACHGKCFLNTQLNKEKDAENGLPLPNFENKQQPVFFTFSDIYLPELNHRIFHNRQFIQPEKHPLDGYLSEVFRPPQV